MDEQIIQPLDGENQVENQPNQPLGTQENQVENQAEIKCRACGAILAPGQAFCPQCGAKQIPDTTKCSNCGEELQPGQAFCPKCGSSTAVQQTPPVGDDDNKQNFTAKFNKKRNTIIGIVAAVVAIAILLIVLVPKLAVTPEKLMNEGNYIEAYKKAKGDEKLDVLAENMVAVLSQESSEGLKDPTSFELTNAWYYPFMHSDGRIGGYVILDVLGTNSFGGTVGSYWAYTLGSDEEWNYFGNADVSYDEDDDDYAESLTKIVVRAGMQKGKKLTKDQVKRINAQFEADTLYKVEQIEWKDVDTSSFPEG